MYMIPDNSLVEVVGYVYLQNIEQGAQYRVEHSTYKGHKTYKFFRPRGKVCVAHHYTDVVNGVFLDTNHRQTNKIVLTAIGRM